MGPRVGISWGSYGREDDPEAWVLLRSEDGQVLGYSSSQGGALRLAHALWEDLDASLRLPGPTIIIRDGGSVLGAVAHRKRMSRALAQLEEQAGAVMVHLSPATLARLHRLRGERPLAEFIATIIERKTRP